MKKNLISRLSVILLMIAACGRSDKSKQNVTANNKFEAAKYMVSNMELGKKIIDEHVLELDILFKEVEVSNSEEISITKSQFDSEIEKMIAVEELLYQSLNENDRSALRKYANEKLGVIKKEVISATASKLNILQPNSENRIGQEHGYSYAVGFIVCHVKCCVGGAGRGISAGLGCYDCDTNEETDGCPID